MSPKLRGVCRNLLDLIRQFKDRQGQHPAEMFEQLPTQDELPDYYLTISEPRDLATVEGNLKDGDYSNPHHFVNDVCLVFQNALIYNDEESEIFQDAKVS